ncbi:MAG: enoyl-CoA hydratase/isomerase family protein, partial [Candidatus Eremiobacteraeota bacterium]|nr:enoyl-CoA hydratase/isomerase family protein [Candidatus Eremiobacteraeota bacterium]
MAGRRCGAVGSAAAHPAHLDVEPDDRTGQLFGWGNRYDDQRRLSRSTHGGVFNQLRACGARAVSLSHACLRVAAPGPAAYVHTRGHCAKHGRRCTGRASAARNEVDVSDLEWKESGEVVTVVLSRVQKKNPLTFEMYEQLRDRFKALQTSLAKSVVLTGDGGNFCSGGDVREIIGPLTERSYSELLAFTQLTGEVVKAMRACPQPIIAAIDGVCAGAGAILAMASDLRFGTARSEVAFLFPRVGLGGCDMGACAILPRIIGLGRASELLYTGRAMSGEQALAWGFYNELHPPDDVFEAAHRAATTLAAGPALAHAM